MIVSREVLTHHAIRPYSSDNHGSLLGSVPRSHGGERWHFVGCPVAIEREAVGSAQEVDPHGLTERLRTDASVPNHHPQFWRPLSYTFCMATNSGADHIRLFEHQHRIGFPTPHRCFRDRDYGHGTLAKLACTEHTTSVVNAVQSVESDRQRRATGKLEPDPARQQRLISQRRTVRRRGVPIDWWEYDEGRITVNLNFQ